MTSAELMETPVPPAHVLSTGARPLASCSAVRAEEPAGRGPQSAGPATARRDAVRPGARPVRHDRPTRGRPVRGGCLLVPAGAGRPAGEWSVREPAAAPLRLTRRGRRLVAALSIAIGLALASAILGTGLGNGHGLQLAGRSSVVVEAGDTLWSIAREVAPQEDTRAVVYALEEVNELESTVLVPGQVLQLP